MARQTLSTHTVTTRRLTIELSREDLLEFLETKGLKPPQLVNASVYFQVPSGGDWSGMDIDIDKDHPVTVTWTETEESIDD